MRTEAERARTPSLSATTQVVENKIEDEDGGRKSIGNEPDTDVDGDMVLGEMEFEADSQLGMRREGKAVIRKDVEEVVKGIFIFFKANWRSDKMGFFFQIHCIVFVNRLGCEPERL